MGGLDMLPQLRSGLVDDRNVVIGGAVEESGQTRKRANTWYTKPCSS